LQQLRDHIVLLYFGYTSCPDVCPTELGKMASVLNSVPQPQKDMLRGLFVTVDPDRDSRTRLKEYLSYFDDRIIGLTGNREQIDRVVDQYHASYRIRKEGARVIVNHSSNLYLIDQRGQVVTMVPFGMSTDHLTQLVDRLLDNPSSSLENN
jgi:cytochrome oxidase Cu insertion factor (SCO1/SenC/PrrC family)